jgi:hypothetical protein
MVESTNFTAKELSKLTGIPIYEIRELDANGKIDSEESPYHGSVYPKSVLKQLRDLGYLDIPDISDPPDSESNIESLESTRHNKIWINNGVDERYIPSDSTIPEGYARGRAPRIREAVSKTKTGKIMVHKDGKYEMIKPSQLPDYLSDGWSEGRIPGSYNSINGRITINDGVHETFISKDEDIPIGWHIGRLSKSGNSISKSLTGRSWIHRDSEEKRVLSDTLPYYFERGWKRGRIKWKDNKSE